MATKRKVSKQPKAGEPVQVNQDDEQAANLLIALSVVCALNDELETIDFAEVEFGLHTNGDAIMVDLGVAGSSHRLWDSLDEGGLLWGWDLPHSERQKSFERELLLRAQVVLKEAAGQCRIIQAWINKRAR